MVQVGGRVYPSSEFFRLFLLGGSGVLLIIIGVTSLSVRLWASAWLEVTGSTRCTKDVWAFTNDALGETGVVLGCVGGSTFRVALCWGRRLGGAPAASIRCRPRFP